MFCVYILYSPSRNVYYKGFSEDVEKRLGYHLNSRDHEQKLGTMQKVERV